MKPSLWDKHYTEHPNQTGRRGLYTKLIPYLSVGANRILDIGCGSGIGMMELSKYYPYATMIGLDFSARGCKEAQRKLPKAVLIHEDIQIWRWNITANLVLCVQTLEHLADNMAGIAALIGGMRRVTAEGGQLIISVPFRNVIPDKDHLIRFDEHSFDALNPGGVHVLDDRHLVVTWRE